ncbi:MAG TPA: EamA family transporter [Candidatus Acidoferrum sp.]|nr:EamA family transporter [Candidatus Acidoferrum sp.]
MNNIQTTPPPRTLLIAAFAAIYIVWGSTYLAIRVVVETLPPFLSAGARFLVAGAMLLLLLRARGTPMPSRDQWRAATVTGVLLLLGGNGLVVWAEQSISSGFTALLVALAPVWFALLEWLRPNGVRPRTKTVVGIIIGFIGVAMLVNARGSSQGQTHWLGILAVLLAGFLWAAGSLYSKHKNSGGSPWMNAAAQMLCGGVALALTGLLFGEPFRTDWAGVSGRSLAALVYLIVFGSWIGFSAYVWLLKASTPARVSTYAYVNPVIAVLLGWAMLGETLDWRMLWGALVIVVGVITITVPQSALANVFNRMKSAPARVR